MYYPKFIFSLLLCAIALFQCKKDAFMTGALPNEWRCNIDGKAWPTEDNQAAITIQLNRILFNANTTDDQFVTAVAQGSDSVGTYVFLPNSTDIAQYSAIDLLSSSIGLKTYSSALSSATDSYFKVTGVDTTEKTMSGEFQFTGKHLTSSVEVKVTEGSFSKIPFRNLKSNQPASSVSCKYNGSSFGVTQVHASDQDGTIRIILGNQAGIRQVMLNIESDLAPGTYDLNYLQNQTMQSTFGQVITENAGLDFSDTGVLTISKNDKNTRHIEGTFNFSTTDEFGGGQTVDISNGVFSVDYE
jgi:hypothetical protein